MVTMLYAALGDSITYGYSSTSDAKRFVNQIQTSLSKQQKVNLYLHAKAGWTSTKLRKSLSAVPECIWDEARLITLMIGGNDLLRVTPWLLDGSRRKLVKAADCLHDNLVQIVNAVRRPGSKLVIATLYNPFPNSIVAEECVEVLNKAIRSTARQKKLLLADIRQQYLGREGNFISGYKKGSIHDFRLRGNPIHPNDLGHLTIARTILRVYRRSLQTARASQRSQKYPLR